MRFTQTAVAGVLVILDSLLVENRFQYIQQNDPDNPVATGYATAVVAPDGTCWTIVGPNLRVSGFGTQIISLPSGEYEITLDTE